MAKNYQLPTGKRIQVYKSGDEFFQGAAVTINPFHIRTMDSFLNHVQEKINPQWGAIRSVHTPNTGSAIQSLDDILKQGTYVVAGNQGFAKIRGGYENIGKTLFKPKKLKRQRECLTQPFRRHKKLQPDVINVRIYRNGHPDVAPVPFQFTKDDLHNWTRALKRLSDEIRHVGGPIKRLYNTNGKILTSPFYLKDKAFYVAASFQEGFIREDYIEEIENDFFENKGESTVLLLEDNPTREPFIRLEEINADSAQSIGKLSISSAKSKSSFDNASVKSGDASADIADSRKTTADSFRGSTKSQSQVSANSAASNRTNYTDEEKLRDSIRGSMTSLKSNQSTKSRNNSAQNSERNTLLSYEEYDQSIQSSEAGETSNKEDLISESGSINMSVKSRSNNSRYKSSTSERQVISDNPKGTISASSRKSYISRTSTNKESKSNNRTGTAESAVTVTRLNANNRSKSKDFDREDSYKEKPESRDGRNESRRDSLGRDNRSAKSNDSRNLATDTYGNYQIYINSDGFGNSYDNYGESSSVKNRNSFLVSEREVSSVTGENSPKSQNYKDYTGDSNSVTSYTNSRRTEYSKEMHIPSDNQSDRNSIHSSNHDKDSTSLVHNNGIYNSNYSDKDVISGHSYPETYADSVPNYGNVKNLQSSEEHVASYGYNSADLINNDDTVRTQYWSANEYSNSNGELNRSNEIDNITYRTLSANSGMIADMIENSSQNSSNRNYDRNVEDNTREEYDNGEEYTYRGFVAREVDYDIDDGGVYRTPMLDKLNQSAKEILDTSLTKVDLPVDMQEPIEVQEQLMASGTSQYFRA